MNGLTSMTLLAGLPNQNPRFSLFDGWRLDPRTGEEILRQGEERKAAGLGQRLPLQFL